MRISDWSSDGCSSDLQYSALRSHYHSASARRRRDYPDQQHRGGGDHGRGDREQRQTGRRSDSISELCLHGCEIYPLPRRSEEQTSELQSIMRISYAVFCLNKNIIVKTNNTKNKITIHKH